MGKCAHLNSVVINHNSNIPYLFRTGFTGLVQYSLKQNYYVYEYATNLENKLRNTENCI